MFNSLIVECGDHERPRGQKYSPLLGCDHHINIACVMYSQEDKFRAASTANENKVGINSKIT